VIVTTVVFNNSWDWHYSCIPALPAGRELIRRSFEFRTYTPCNSDEWDEALVRFKKLVQ